MTTTEHCACTDCYLLIGTGDATHFDGAYCEPESTERLEECTAGIDKLVSSEGAKWITADGGREFDSEFSNRGCDVCGTSLAGSRFTVTTHAS